jgi:hypothetical protein
VRFTELVPPAIEALRLMLPLAPLARVVLVTLVKVPATVMAPPDVSEKVLPLDALSETAVLSLMNTLPVLLPVVPLAVSVPVLTRMGVPLTPMLPDPAS